MPRINSSGWKSGDLRIWSGELDNIPNGWELATEMIDRAVVGAGGAYAKGQKFGADSRTPSISVNNHTLSTSRMPSHSHGARTVISGGGSTRAASRNDTSNSFDYSIPTNGAGSSGAHNHGASSSAVDTRQQSIAVIWIRKL